MLRNCIYIFYIDKVFRAFKVFLFMYTIKKGQFTIRKFKKEIETWRINKIHVSK